MLARVVGVRSVWVVLLCLCLYARQSHGILTVRGMGWWHAHRARRGRAHCSVDDGGRSKCDSHFFTAASSLSLLCACLRLTWRPSPGCLVHVSGLVEPAPLRVVDAPNLPASGVDSTRPLCLPWYRGGPIGACPPLKRCAPPVSLSACHGAGGGAPGRCVSPEPVLFRRILGECAGVCVPRGKALATFIGEPRLVRRRARSRPLTWWGTPSRRAARRSCRRHAGGHSGTGSRTRAG